MHQSESKRNNWFEKLRLKVAPEPQLARFSGYFREKPRLRPSGERVLLVQCVEDVFYFALFGQIAASLREQQLVRVEQLVLRSLTLGESKSLGMFIKAQLLNVLANYKWTRIYRSFCDGIGYRSTSLRPIDDVVDMFRSWACWRNLRDRQSLVDLVIDDVPVGDLINDSFLRFKPAPTVDLKDLYLAMLIWQAHRDLRRAQAYFSRVKPRLYLTSYSTYIQHGIPVRVALKHGVRVFSFGNYQEFAKELSISDWVHTKNPDGYARQFHEMSDQDEKLAVAEAGLEKRLAGGIDSATAYMKQSAYAQSGAEVPDVKNAIVIFLHDFYDSPHIYREVVFPDFWEWICFTIETLQQANIRFFLKPHPNQISTSGGVLKDLLHRYPDISIISANVTNKQLAETGMACAVTVYGTVAHEMAYLGVPTIACAHHPHVSFNFCRTARTREEYANYLRQHEAIEIDKLAMHRESLIFYYMHNLSMSEDAKALRDANWQFHSVCARPEADGSVLLEDMERISRLAEFKRNVAAWAGMMNGDVAIGKGQ